MPRVKFITTGHSHLVGNFSDGDTYTGDEAVCRHFVEDAHCAKWDVVQASAQPDAATAAPTKAEAKRKAAAEKAAAKKETAPAVDQAPVPGSADQAEAGQG